MPELSVPWGRQELQIPLPDGWQVQQVASPSLQAAPEDWPDRLAATLGQPVAGEPLERLLMARRAGRIALIVEDITRHSPVAEILSVVMREIDHAEIPAERVEIVFATGMHPPMSVEQARQTLGPLADRIRWRSNPWDDRSAHVCLGAVGRAPVWVDRGVASADLRILISSVSPHLQAGFGGGYKMLLPGCAHLETIRGLHRLGLGRRMRQLIGLEAERNPMRAAIDEGGRLVDAAGGRSFAVQFILDAADHPAIWAAGDVMATQQMLAKQCSVACGVVMHAAADVLITNAHPRDFDLWQCLKSIPNTMWAVRPGGAIICLARCEAGLYGMRVPPWPLSPSWMRRLVRLLGPETISSTLTRLVPGLAGDAAFFVRLAARAAYRNHMIMVSPALHAAGVRFPGLHIVPGVAEAVAWAERILPRGGPRRAVVFPYGGITFPIPALEPPAQPGAAGARQ